MADPLVKVLLDTSIYIPFINQGIYHPALEISEGIPLLYMSAVVVEELYAGAFDPYTVRLLDKIYNTFDRLGRLVTPLSSDWQKTGKIVAKIGKKYGFEEIFLSRLVNDVLIALSARRIGAITYTKNLKDFQRVKEYLEFKLGCFVSLNFIL